MAYQLKVSKNWIEIEEQLKPLGNKEKGDLFEKICEYYLLSEKVYEIKKVYGYGSYPREVIEKLGLVNQIDKGADLVAERENGELWIIQCKFRSNRKEVVTYAELSTALAISDKAEFRLIMANTESLPEIVNARGNIGTVLVDAFTGKDEKFWTGFFEWVGGGKLKKIEINPHDYQVDAIRKSKEYFAAKDRGQIVMACGTGKSYVSYWIAEELGAQHVLVMVPSLALLRQLLGDWTTANKGSAFEYLCVCSDASVIESASEDSIDSHLYELDVPVTTKPHEVVRFLERKSDRKMKIIFTTYQSSDVICDALKGLDGFQFDLAVCDEAHRTAGVGGMLFSKVLSDENITCKKRLFLTATPKIYSQGVIKMGERQDIELCSMDDEGIYGDRIYYLSFGEAIQRKLLTDYRVLAIGVNDSDFHQLLKRDELLLLKDKNGFTASAYDLATKIALVKAAKQYALTHTITFHARVKSAQRFVEGDHSVNHLFEDKSMFFGHVNGEMSSGERASVLDTFRNASRGVISNARCLTEGVDVKAIDSVYFVDPKYNVIDIVQATGRAVRLYPEKELGYVIVPVLINGDQDEETVLNSSAFDQVWKVIKAMMSQDERLEEIISKVRRYEGEEKQGANRKKEMEELYMKLREKAEFIDLPKRFDLERFEKHLYLRLVDTNGRSWDYMLGQLVEWRKINPDRWPSPSAKDLEEKKLGGWCSKKRGEYKTHKLSEKCIKELNAIGFLWDPLADQWTNGIAALRKFRLKNPNRWPRRYSRDTEENVLEIWCKYKRSAYKNDQLSGEQVKELNAIGFQWDPLADQWIDMVTSLKEFRLKNPDRWPNPHGKDPKEKIIGRWCSSRRAEYKNDQLSGERVKELENLGFRWDIFMDQWVNGIAALKEFRLENPNCWPNQHAKNQQEKKLGIWCSARRKEHRKRKLNGERIKELEDLGFQWEPLEEQLNELWDRGLSALKEFRLKNPNRWPSPKAKDLEEKILGNWVQHRRTEYKKRKLSQERIKELEDLGFR